MVLELHRAVSHSFYKQDQFEYTFSYQSAVQAESHERNIFWGKGLSNNGLSDCLIIV